MAMLNEIKDYLDKELNIEAIDDYCSNGLEVQGADVVKKIVFMVDASVQGFEEAIRRNADMIIVHHGLIFGSIKRVCGILYNRIKLLINNDISLYAAHLPLDVHPVWGNNAQLAKLLGLNDIRHYDVGKYEQLMVVGCLPSAVSFEKFLEQVSDKINDKSRYLKFSDRPVKKIAVISGSGSQAVENAHQLGADIFLTGESKLEAYHTARELGISIVFAGHYYTEIIGLQALCNHIKTMFDVTAEFIDLPTEL
ncbi:MAG: Nif3-like dinuclear metal center hexameric protein [Candidatus Auribacterota bacterium]|jgi:dinuclear metal center YbgI/SA1388 family protein|nr:Nif3-like dinuclear metal center hexameric protein [Candidatus Auribacterota bacterium]